MSIGSERARTARPLNGLMEAAPAVRLEQARLLYRSGFPLLANVATSTTLAALLWTSVPQAAVVLWLAVMLTTVGARALMRVRFRQSTLTAANAGDWIRRYAIGATATGLVWSVVTLVPLTVDPLPYTVFAAFTVGGMGVGSVAANASFLPAFYGFLVPTTVPFALAIAMRGSPEEIAMSVMGAVFIGATVTAGHYANRTLLSVFRLEADNARLIQGLTSARDELAQARDNLELQVEDRTAELRSANESLARENAERRSAEDALRESEAWVRTIAESASDWFWERDADQRYTFVSDRHAVATGLSSERCIGKSPRELYGLHEEEWRRHLARTDGRGDYRDVVFTVRRNDGARCIIRESGKAVFAADGSFRGYRGAGSDITAEVEAREAVDNARAQLAHVQKMEAIGQLTGGVAHDFNNLLGVVIGNVEALADDLAVDKRVVADRAINAALRGAELVARLLAFSRKQELAPEPLEVNEQVMEVIGMLGRTIGSEIEITPELAPGLPPLSADKSQLQTALINLAVNARDAMPRGGQLAITTGIRILDRASAQRVQGGAAPGNYVGITVRDTGTGMTRDVAESAIDPFFTTKRASEGSGLGLSMVYGFVKQSGGHLLIDSEPGRGTAVTLCFPFAAPSPRAEDGVAPGDLQSRARGEHILVVEDNDDLRDLVTKLLTSLDYRVSVAKDAEAALRVIETARDIDLLFSDVILSRGMNGFELGEEAASRIAGLKVLFMSGYTDAELPDDPVTGRRVALLRKPFTKAALASAVRGAVGGDDR